jgi:hypothetical protein
MLLDGERMQQLNMVVPLSLHSLDPPGQSISFDPNRSG